MKIQAVLPILALIFIISCNSTDDNIYTDNKIVSDDQGCGLNDKDVATPDAIYEIDESANPDIEEPEFENEPDIDLDNKTDDQEDIEIPEKDADLSYDSDADTDTALCPADMVENGNSCIDRYEASRLDATVNSQGTNSSTAVSKAGVIPWMVNPMTDDHFQNFKSACTAAGKRLCKDDEWKGACEGPEKTLYSWGNAYDRERCNNVDNFCDNYCADNGIAPEDCVLTENCGYTYNCFKSVPTGSYPDCKNYSDAFDINGNAWEITDAGSVYMTRGGAFNCAGPSDRLKCQFNATWTGLYAGFRCCKDK